MGGLEKLDVKMWKVSDDTVMHLATAHALTTPHESFDTLITNMAKEYVRCLDDFGERAAGPTTRSSLRRLVQSNCQWKNSEFNNYGGGCGGSMRAMCIGLRYPTPEAHEMLMKVAIESGRLTHNHPIGFLGSYVSALFTSFAVNNVPIEQWGKILLDKKMPLVVEYLTSDPIWEYYEIGVNNFISKFRSYLVLRNLYPENKENDTSTTEQHGTGIGIGHVVFPVPYGVVERDEYYSSISFSGWGGASGDDSVIIAYDALLGCKGEWAELVNRGVLHGGDNDSTGTIAAAWYGAFYGYGDVYEINKKNIEKKEELLLLAEKLYLLRGITKGESEG